MQEWAKLTNQEMLRLIERCAKEDVDMLAIEMIASMGMSVGQTIFDTCVWAGRFIERWAGYCEDDDGSIRLVRRVQVKRHLCGTHQAKDPNIRQALLDKFGPGKELAVGKKATPGPLYGLSGDGWAALGVAVTAAETDAGRPVTT
jgi:hypothetical protein